MGWDVVEYCPRHRPAVLALMKEVQGHAASSDRFAWEFEHNPVGDTNVFLAVAGDEVVGVSCHNTFRMRLAGGSEVVSFPLNVLTRADFRGRGVFRTLERANEEHAAQIGAALMLSFPNAESTPIFLNRLEWIALPAPRAVGRPRSAWRRKPRPPVSLEPVPTIGRWADEIWAENGDADRCIVRDTTYLNWRFVECPDRDYRVLVVRDGREIVGYFITATTVKRGIRLAYVANALLMPSWRSAYAALRSAALATASAPLLLDLATPVSANPSSQTLKPASYLPLPKRLNFIAKPLGNRFDEVWIRARPWSFQLGDLDFF